VKSILLPSELHTIRHVKVVPVITGIGLITPLGRSADATWKSLLAGRCITDHARVEAINHKQISRVAALAIEATDQAIRQAKWSDTNAAVICSTSKGSVESWISPAGKTQTPVPRRTAEPVSSIQSINFGLADLSTHVAHHTGFTTGPRLTLSSACAGGLHGLIRAAMMIESGEADRVLVVAAEASVHPLFLGSFRRLGVLVPEGELCRPFDKNRHGFLMSDAAAAICIEAQQTETHRRDTDLRPVRGAQGARTASTSNQIQHGPEVRVTIDRFSMGGDATHLTGSDPQRKVLRHLLRRTLNDQFVDLVHAHGTGTISNDSTELAAIESSFCDGSSPHLFSHKAALGHSLGASGLVAVVINCLCHQHGIVPPNINTIDPLETSKLQIDQEVARRSIHRSIVHAAGFGGPMAVVALRSVRILSEGVLTGVEGSSQG